MRRLQRRALAMSTTCSIIPTSRPIICSGPPLSLVYFTTYALHHTPLAVPPGTTSSFLRSRDQVPIWHTTPFLRLLWTIRAPEAKYERHSHCHPILRSQGPFISTIAVPSIPSEKSLRRPLVETYPTPTDIPQLPTPLASHSNVPSPANSMSPATPNYEGDGANIVS